MNRLQKLEKKIREIGETFKIDYYNGEFYDFYVLNSMPEDLSKEEQDNYFTYWETIKNSVIKELKDEGRY